MRVKSLRPAGASLLTMGAPSVSRIVASTAVKALGDWLLDVLGVPFGGPVNGKDAQGQYFTPETRLHLERYKPMVIYHHAVTPDWQPTDEIEEIGEVQSYDMQGDGWHFKILLDKTKAKAKEVWDAAQAKMAYASSGAVEHLVRPIDAQGNIVGDGAITEWPMAELSLFPLKDGMRPVNAYAIAVPAVKAHYAKAGRELPPVMIAEGLPIGQSATLDSAKPRRVFLIPKRFHIKESSNG